MKRYLYIILFLAIQLCACKTSQEPVIGAEGKEVIKFRALPFPIEDVRLKEGTFLHATALNANILLGYEPDRFLAKFRMEAGLEARAEHYHGWEDFTVAGHSLGHYLTAISLMYQSTGDPEFRKRALYITDELALCQQADGDGYIGAFPDGKRILEEEVARGDIRSQGFNLNGIWVPYYTQHKVMDGLFQVYTTFGYEKALDINIAFADWLHQVVSGISPEKVQEMLRCEYGGINESLAELYGLTGDRKYLETSRIFQDSTVVGHIIAGEDVLAGKHANTQIPKFVGLARRYELDGDPEDRQGAMNFWEMMVHQHTYVTGGNGNHEYLGVAGKLNHELSDNTTESCNVYNMLKLSEHLFMWTADPAVMDYYERALFNHIHSSQHPHTGHVIYNLSLDMGGFKVYQDPEDFTCCVGTGMESHSKYSRNIYYHNEEELYVVQFIASELKWQDRGVVLTQDTRFPEDENLSFVFRNEEPVDFTLKIRYPSWAIQGMNIRVNGKKHRVKEKPGSFVGIRRKWEDGDRVEVEFPFSLRTEAMPDNPDRIAIFNGPLVLAADLGPVPDSNAADPLYVPVLMTKEGDPAKWLSPLKDEFNAFKTDKVAHPRDVVLRPFYRTHDRHYTIFWDTYTGEEWKLHQEAYAREQERKKALKARTIDLFRMGEMQPERDHNFENDGGWIEEFRRKKSRVADRGGWFAFDMRVEEESELSLSVEYWGGYSGSKTFDIYVDDELIATQNISNMAPGRFIDVEYPIPPHLLEGREKIHVKFLPHEGHRAGPVFIVRTVRNDSLL